MTHDISVGLDLGTTNCALAAVHPTPSGAQSTSLEVPQVISPGEVAARELLPSFLYLPADGEFADGAFDLPWSNRSEPVGTFARQRGSTGPMRLIASAKSWLSHERVDRRGPILPWGAPEDVSKISPVEASARYLTHLREAWDHAHPESPLAELGLVLTVPASFDAVARELTVEAAERAGLARNVRLLEEPQAALYAWLSDHASQWRNELGVGDVILVCDIGGGTTDFSLIEVREQDGELDLERIAVGEHILLGGDNMDLALAHTVAARLESEGKRLDDWQLRALNHECRRGKEVLLSTPDIASHPLAVPSRGSKLIGGTLRAELHRDELRAVLLDGFLPEVEADARPETTRRVGLTTVGLPYATDASITRHLAAFLARATEARGGKPVHPSAVLFNGGVTHSTLIRDRITRVLGGWAERAGASAPKVLDGGDPDLAVCRGAAHYGHLRRSGGLRIRSGTARAYYVGVERAGLAVPGMPAKVDAHCIAPFGMEEGTDTELPQPFGLIVGEPAAFRFFESTTRRHDEVGAVASPAELEELPAIETTLEGEAGAVAKVRLHAQITEVGVLELSAIDDATEGRWKLHFDVRVD